MASTVSGRPGPVPAGGENCARAAAPPSENTRAISPRIRRGTFPPWSGHSGDATPRFGTSPCAGATTEYRGVLPNDRLLCRARRKGPLSHLLRTNEKRKDTKSDLAEAPFARGTRMPEEPRPAGHGQDRRKRIEPHFERQAGGRPTPAQQHDADGLSDELNNQPHRKNGGNYGAEPQRQTEAEGKRAKEKQRNVGKVLFRMQPGKDGKEISVERRRIRHAGIAEQHGEDRGHGDPQNQPGGHLRRGVSIDFLHEQAGDELRILRLAPRHDAQNAQLKGEIQRGDSGNREENAARNVPLRILNLSAQMTNVVVAPIAVNRAHHGRTQAREPDP